MSVMNIALPPQQEDKKRQEIIKSEGGKRKRSDWDNNPKSQTLSSIRKAFEQHANEVDQSSNYRVDRRVKTSEKEEKGFAQNGDLEDNPYSEGTAMTSASKLKDRKDEETSIRKLSISNFEPIQPKNKLSKLTTPLH